MVERIAEQLFRKECELVSQKSKRRNVGVCTIRREPVRDHHAYEHRVAKALANYVLGGDAYTKLSKCEYLLFVALLSKMKKFG